MRPVNWVSSDLLSQRGTEEEERKDTERPWTLGSLVIVMTGPSDQDRHAPVELPREVVNLQRVGSEVRRE